jgi:hypothetical protein
MEHQQRWKKEESRSGLLKGGTLKVQYLLSSKQVALRQQQMKLLVQQQKQRSKLQLKRAPDERRDVDGHADGFCGQKPALEGRRQTK